MDSDVSDDKVIRPFFRDVMASIKWAVRYFGQVYVCCDWRSWSAWWEAAQRVKLKPSNKLIWDKGNAGLGSQWANGYEEIGFWTNKPARDKMFAATHTGTRLVLRPNVLRMPAAGDDGPARVDLVDPVAAAELEGTDADPEALRRALLTYGRVSGADRVHNAAKPIELIEEIIDAATDLGEIVLDLFGGGGSTLLACARTQRRARLMEIDPLWCDVIRHRWTEWATEAGIDAGSGALTLEDAPALLGKAAAKPPKKRTGAAPRVAKPTEDAPPPGGQDGR